MRLLKSADLLAIAAEVLECGTAAVLETTDLDAVDLTVEQVVTAARCDDLAVAGAALLGGLVRRRPFARSNRRIAVLGTVQLGLLNGCDLELRPVGELDELLDAVAAGTIPDGELADQLRGRLRRHNSRLEVTMFERFTDGARRVVTLAQEEARILNHAYVGTEHVLLGLLHEEESAAAQVLSGLGVTLLPAEDAVREIVGEGRSPARGHIPFTPRSKKLLELSIREARHLGHKYISPEHILLGLVREGEGVGAQVLQKFGADLALVRQRTVQVLNQQEDGTDAGTAAGFLDEDTERSRKGTGSSGRRHLLIRELKAVLDENERLHTEVDRLRTLLRNHDINPDT